MQNRIVSLDYLRGLCAFSIMMYHYLSYSKVTLESEDFFGRMGIYGVSIFYILSGLTLFMVYDQRFKVVDFYIKRVFRIFPLLWMAMTLTLLLWSSATLSKILLNYSGLFGFVRWWDYIGTGVWSIGNELFFYICFPVFYFTARSKYYLIAIGILLYSVYLWFAFVEISGVKLSDEWRDYTNPLNQVALFFTGFIIGKVFKDIEVKQWAAVAILVLSVCVFAFYPVHGNKIELVIGMTRLVFTLACAAVCFSFFKMRVPKIEPLRKLGEATYSLYLLHPIVWFVITKATDLHPAVNFITCSAASLIISYASYKWFESPFIKLGGRISKKYP